MNPALLRGGAMMAVQVVATGGSLFLLYRLLLDFLGAEQVGTWAVVAAVITIFRLADCGFSGGVVKIVAARLARRERTEAAIAVETGVLFVAASSGAVLLLGYPAVCYGFATWLPSAVLPPGFVPVAFLAAWLNIVAMLPCAALDGALRYDLRGLVLLLNSVVQLAAAAVLVPRAGLVGLALAQVVQWGVTLVLGWWLLKARLAGLRWIPRRFDRATWRDLFAYGFAFQSLGVAALIADPATKLLLTHFGAFESVAYYDMANRFVSQFRQLFLSGIQILTAYIANLKEAAPTRVRSVYVSAFTVITVASVIAFGGIAISLPFVSYLWLGHAQHAFVDFSYWLLLGGFISTLGGPAFFTNLGTGAVYDNVAAQLIASVTNIVLGALLGLALGTMGVVSGAAVGPAVAGIFLVVRFGHAHRVALSELFPSATTLVVATAVGALVLAFAFEGLVAQDLGNFVGFLAGAAGFSILVLPCVWLHPIRKAVFRGGPR